VSSVDNPDLPTSRNVYDDAPSLVDPDLVAEMPTTARGLRTRASLVKAARVVFERDGFLNSRVVDISAEANVATGTFYTYFQSKEEAFAAVLQTAQDDMMHPGMPRTPVAGDSEPASVAAVFEASHRAYLEAYRRNAKLMMLMEQVATIDPAFALLRRRRGQTFVDRNTGRIKQLQDEGLADPSLDAAMTSRALSSMVSRVAYTSFVLEEDFDFEIMVETLTKVWVNALKLST
jgi:AcrR family transcriptional regulator